MSEGSLQSRTNKMRTLPLSSLLRPIPPVLDSKKVDSMVQTLKSETPNYIPSPAPDTITPGELPPVDVLYYRSPSGKDFFFAFGGCHRLQAYEKAQVEGVSCKVLRVTKPMLKVYLGGSVDVIVGKE